MKNLNPGIVSIFFSTYWYLEASVWSVSICCDVFFFFQPCPRPGCITGLLSLDGSVLLGNTPTTTASRKVCGSCLQCSWCFSSIVEQRSKLVSWTQTFSAVEFLICKRHKCQVLAYGRWLLHNRSKFWFIVFSPPISASINLQTWIGATSEYPATFLHVSVSFEERGTSSEDDRKIENV